MDVVIYKSKLVHNIFIIYTLYLLFLSSIITDYFYQFELNYVSKLILVKDRIEDKRRGRGGAANTFTTTVLLFVFFFLFCFYFVVFFKCLIENKLDLCMHQCLIVKTAL